MAMMPMTRMEELIKEIGESVYIHFEPRETDHPWTVGLTHTPLIHEHWPDPMDGLEWLANHRNRFEEWRSEHGS